MASARKRAASIGIVFCLAVAGVAVTATTAGAATPNTAEDNFHRADAAGWGTTTNGDGLPNYAWQRSLAAGQPYSSINANAGVITYAGTNGHKVAGYVKVPAAASGDILEKVVFTNVGQAVAGACLDVAGGTSWYQADMNTFLKTLELRKRKSGVMTTVASIPFTYTAGTAYWLREDVQVSGGTALVRARAWADGAAEPSAWGVSWTDTAPLAAGQAGAMGDWFARPAPGAQVRFLNWAYSAAGLAAPAP